MIVSRQPILLTLNLIPWKTHCKCTNIMLYSITILQKIALRYIYLTYMYSFFTQITALGQKKSFLQAGRIEISVPKTGLEPTQLLHHQNLKLARLPIPPPGHFWFSTTKIQKNLLIHALFQTFLSFLIQENRTFAITFWLSN